MAKYEEKKFAQSIGKMTVDELGIELKNLRERLYTLRSQAVTEKVEDVSQFGIAKRNIARLMTEQSARRIKGAGAARKPAAPHKHVAAAPKAAKAKARSAGAKSPRKAGHSARAAKSAKGSHKAAHPAAHKIAHPPAHKAGHPVARKTGKPSKTAH